MASDNFNRSNGAPGSPWSQDSVETDPLLIDTNELIGTTNGTLGIIRYTTSSQSVSQVIYSTNSAAALGGPCIHLDGAGSGYYWTTGGVLFRIDAGSFNFLATGITNPSGGDTCKLRRDGNDVVATINGSEVARVTDTTYTTGSPGIGIDGGGFCRLDDWTDLASAGTNYAVTVDELLAISDSVLHSRKFSRLISEFMDVINNDQIARFFSISVSDQLVIDDSILRGTLHGVTCTDTNSVIDDLMRSANLFRQLDDQLIVTDDVIAYRKFYRLIDEVLDVMDLLSKQVQSGGGGTNYVVIVDDAITVLDETLRTVAYRRLSDEALSIFDESVAGASFQRQTSDALTVSDNALIGVLRGRTLDDGFQVVDDNWYMAQRVKTLDDAIDVIDQLLMSRKFIRTLAEMLDITDDLSYSITGAPPTFVADNRIRIGCEQTIRLGQCESIRLGQDQSIVLGGYN